MTKSVYPMIQINQQKILENVSEVVKLCKDNGISVSGVVKGVNGDLQISKCFAKGGCKHLASSRIEQLEAIKATMPSQETMLLRIPMLVEVSEVIRYADISLNSEVKTIKALEQACAEQGKQHRVVLMIDLGDLREGYFNDKEAISIASWIENDLKWVKLEGIGTNLGCYGAIKPTETNLGRLAEIAEAIEAAIGRPLSIVSGGATSTLPLLKEGKVPSKVNNLRIGEGILLNMDLPEIWRVPMENMNQETFLLKAQIIEIKEKPSHPVGEIFIDAFGNTPIYEDKGIRRRAIVGMGKQDFAMEDKLIPLKNGVSIIGSSSDHLLVDIHDCTDSIEVGDVLDFRVYYGPMLHLFTSQYVNKTYMETI